MPDGKSTDVYIESVDCKLSLHPYESTRAVRTYLLSDGSVVTDNSSIRQTSERVNTQVVTAESLLKKVVDEEKRVKIAKAKEKKRLKEEDVRNKKWQKENEDIRKRRGNK